MGTGASLYSGGVCDCVSSFVYVCVYVQIVYLKFVCILYFFVCFTADDRKEVPNPAIKA